MQEPDLSADDAIVLLLAANGPSGQPAESIGGLTRLNKELFLLEAEQGIKLGITFEPKYYGPYSSEISEAVKRLKDGLFISVTLFESQYENMVEVYTLTPRGKIRAARLHERLSPRIKNAINTIKSRYNMRRLDSLLDYVHTKYPSYRLPAQ